MLRMLCFAFLILPLLAGATNARIWDVAADGTGTAPTIQAAIDSCASGDTVLAAPGTYTGAGNRDLDFGGKAIVVMSLSGAAVTIIDCAGSKAEDHRGFYFHLGEDTTSVLRGFTITSGSTTGRGGAICCVGASPKIVENVLTGNYARGGGGGIYCEGTHSVISGNTMSKNETMIWLAAAQDAEPSETPPSMRRDAETGLEVPSGGNICCVSDSSLIELSTITGGKSTYGSAIYCEDSFIRVWSNNISENGGAYTSGTVSLISGDYAFEGNVVSSNRAFFSGTPGLLCFGGVFRIAGNTICGGTGHGQGGSTGGAMFCGPGDYTIENNNIVGNYVQRAGGIYIEGSGVVRNNLISHNEAEHAGPCAVGYATSSYGSSLDLAGGMLINGATSLTVEGNTIIGNHAAWGGGIAIIGCSPEIKGNVIANNGASRPACSTYGDATGKGGGLYLVGSSPLIVGNTIYANRANNARNPSCQGGAGIHCESGSSPTIERNILAKNMTSNPLIVGGIYCDDAACMPSIFCCDVYGNANANYGGTLADQTGLNNNFSLDPLFCDAEHGDFELYISSPCLPGHHPDGGDCGLIGALGGACDFMATLLQGYSTSVSPSAVTITWTLAEAGENLTCSILRAEAQGGEYCELPAPGIARQGMTFTFNDAGVDPGTVYRYRIDVSDAGGRKVLFETDRILTPALPLSLYQNFPNPFNPSTTISYYVPESGPVTLDVYDIAGRRVAELVGKVEEKGRHAVVWTGEDGTRTAVASGVYFYRLTVGKETISKKMVLLR